MNRRRALALAGGGAVAGRMDAAHQHKAAAPAAAYKPQFFTPDEHALLERAAETILPADEHSPGAREARVADHIDFVAANSPEQQKARWKQRLAAFDALARERHGRRFVELDPSQQAAVLDLLAAAERKPATDAEHFFADLKQATLFAYYTSEIGLLKELGYQGNQVLDEFPGCTHAPGTHKA